MKGADILLGISVFLLLSVGFDFANAVLKLFYGDEH